MSTIFTPLSTEQLEHLLAEIFATLTHVINRQVIREWSELRVEKVVVSAKGTMVNVIVKHIPSQDSEPKLCQALKKKRLNCIPRLYKILDRATDTILISEYVEGQGLHQAADQDNYRRAIDALINVQADFWGNTGSLPELGIPVMNADYLKLRAEAGIAGCRQQLASGVYSVVTVAHLDAARNALANYLEALPFLTNLPITLVHGDFHYGNIVLRPSGKMVFLDWESVVAGCGLVDVVGLLDVSSRMGETVPDENDLLARYLKCTTERIGQWINQGDYHRLTCLCRVVRAVEELNWFNSTGADYGERAMRELEIITMAI